MSNFTVTGTNPDDPPEPEYDGEARKTGHIWFEHNAENPCTYEGGTGCPYCDGGLSLCIVCNALEGALTTECCGRPITEEEERQIYNEGTLDFINGEWVKTGSPHSPATYRQRPQIAGVDW